MLAVLVIALAFGLGYLCNRQGWYSLSEYVVCFGAGCLFGMFLNAITR